MSQDIARTELDVLWPDGRRVRVTITVGQPYQDLHLRAWRCPVRLDGMLGRVADIAGEDSLQALLLALRLAHQQLAYAEAKGAKLLIPGEEPDDPASGFDLKTYFGRLGSDPNTADGPRLGWSFQSAARA